MLIDVLRDGATQDPDRAAVVAAGRTLTYAELVTRAEATARGLRGRAVARFGCALEDPIDVVVLLAAASAAGSEVCVYPRPFGAVEIAAAAVRLDHATVVVDAPLEVPGVATPRPSDLSVSGSPPAAPETTPVMILTTGTSGTPKGVRHDWSRLVRSVRRSDQDLGGRWLLAYNLNQFAAYQVLLHAFVHRSTVVVPPSSQARDAMQTLYDAAVTHVSATPTFWRLLVGTIEAERRPVPSLRQLTLGGEAAPATLIAKLQTLFPDARISHVYAGTEFGSVVSVRDGRSGLPLSVLDRDPEADARFRVVDGELQVRSRNGMLGYHGADAPDDWHATGDLVEERDGRLHFVGRTTEIINVGGAKVHPLPIEELVATVPGILVAAVYGKPNAVTGQIVAVDVVAAPGGDRDAIKAGIHAACSVLPAPGRPRRIRFVEALEVRGQKVIRNRSEVGT